MHMQLRQFIVSKQGHQSTLEWHHKIVEVEGGNTYFQSVNLHLTSFMITDPANESVHCVGFLIKREEAAATWYALSLGGDWLIAAHIL